MSVCALCEGECENIHPILHHIHISIVICGSRTLSAKQACMRASIHTIIAQFCPLPVHSGRSLCIELHSPNFFISHVAGLKGMEVSQCYKSWMRCWSHSSATKMCGRKPPKGRRQERKGSGHNSHPESRSCDFMCFVQLVWKSLDFCVRWWCFARCSVAQ